MFILSRPRSVVSSLAALLLLPLTAGAQSVGLSGTRVSTSGTDSRLSAVPVTAPVAIAPVASSEGPASGTPTAQFDVDPLPTSTSAQISAQDPTQTGSPATAESGPTSASATAGIHSASAHRLSRQGDGRPSRQQPRRLRDGRCAHDRGRRRVHRRADHRWWRGHGNRRRRSGRRSLRPILVSPLIAKT